MGHIQQSRQRPLPTLGTARHRLALTCCKCGYNLSGLKTHACPECGHSFNFMSLVTRFTPVARSRGGDWPALLAPIITASLWIGFLLPTRCGFSNPSALAMERSVGVLIGIVGVVCACFALWRNGHWGRVCALISFAMSVGGVATLYSWRDVVRLLS